MRLGWIGIGSVLACCMASAPASAGFLTTHAYAGAYDGFSGEPEHFRVVTGQTGASTGAVAGERYDRQTLVLSASASATVSGGHASALIRSHTEAYAPGAGLFSPNAGALALGAWRDIAYATDLSPTQSLRLTFAVSANLYGHALQRDLPDFNGTLSGFVSNLAELGVRWTTGDVSNALNQGFPNRNGFDLRANVYDGNQGQTELGPKGSARQWDSYSLQNGSFRGTFHIDVPYSEQYGGYGWSVAMLNYSGALGGSAEGDVSHTLGLQAVTRTDGTPVNVRFDSGLRLDVPVAAAPAPSGLALMASGVVPLMGWVMRRRQRTA